MVVFYETHGTGPWSCYFCGSTVTVIGQKTWNGNVHHVDGDKSNDTPDNVVMTHTICHQQHHSPSEELRQQISRKLKGRPSPTRGMRFSSEVNHKKGHPGETNPFFGKTHSNTALSKMRQPRQRSICDHCGKSYAVNWLERHKRTGRCTAQ